MASLQEVTFDSCAVLDVPTLLPFAREALDRVVTVFGTPEAAEQLPSAERLVADVLRRDSSVLIKVTVDRSRTFRFSKSDADAGTEQPTMVSPWQNANTLASYVARAADTDRCRSLQGRSHKRIFVSAPCCDVQPPITVACLMHLSQATETIPAWAEQLLAEGP
jgi:hypothetical protein